MTKNDNYSAELNNHYSNDINNSNDDLRQEKELSKILQKSIGIPPKSVTSVIVSQLQLYSWFYIR